MTETSKDVSLNRMTTLKASKISNLIAAVTILAASLTILIYYFNPDGRLLFIGAIILGGFALSLFVLLPTLLIKASKDGLHKRKAIISAGLLILLLPVLFLLYQLVLDFSSRGIVRVVNATGRNISDVVILSCKQDTLKKMVHREAYTIYTHAGNECMVLVSYKDNDILKEEVIGTTEKLSGKKTVYELGKSSSQ